jgi:hypothetical protein
MDNFDLKKYLIENKVTTNSKMINENEETTLPNGKLKKVVIAGTTYEVGSPDPNDDGNIIKIEKHPKGYFIMGRSKREGYGYGVDMEGNVVDEDQIIDENRQGNFAPFPVLLDFVDGGRDKALNAYEMLGFEVEIDDEVNDVYSVTMEFKGYDWMAVLAILEDCKREGVRPSMLYNKDSYSFEEAMQLADKKAGSDSYDSEGAGTKNYFLNK